MAAKQCLLVVYEEPDYKFCTENLIPTLEQESIKCYTLEADGEINKPILRNFESLLNKAGKVLFVISRPYKFISSPLPLFSLRLVSVDNITSLALNNDVRYEDDLSCLRSCSRISFLESNWKDTLLDILLFSRPVFSHALVPSTLPNCVRLRGFDISDMLIDIYGIALQVKNTSVRIDIGEFRKHLLDHADVGTARICGECSKLCTDRTTVSVVYNTYDDTICNTADLNTDLSGLCGNVLDFASLRDKNVMSSLACTVTGPIKDLNFIRSLWLSIFYKTLNNKRTSEVIKYPDFESREERLKSFPSLWPNDKVPKAEELADAGLFFFGYPHLAKCFMCGYLLMNWRRDDVPWQAHAAINSRCPFIQKRHTKEEINAAVASYTESRYSVNKEYESTEARRKTFNRLDSQETKLLNEVCEVEDLVEAGFYYTGTCDMFNCYACGVTLSCITSRIMATHAKISPKCQHVLNKRGKEYVKDVAAENTGKTIVTFKLRKFDDQVESQRNLVMFTAVKSTEENC